MFWLADLVLAIHFALAAFVASGLLLIPMGAICKWQWVRNRIFHSVSFCGYIWRALSGSCVYGGTVPPFPTKSINHISNGPLQHYFQNILFFNEKVSEPITGH